VKDEINKLLESDNLDENLAAMVLLPHVLSEIEAVPLLLRPTGFAKLLDIFEMRLAFWQFCAFLALEYISRKYFVPLLIEGDHDNNSDSGDRLKRCLHILSTFLEMTDAVMRECSIRCLIVLVTHTKQYGRLHSTQHTKELITEVKQLFSEIKPRIQSIAESEYFHMESMAPQLLQLVENL
jgi:hypothetical protein